MLDCGAIGVEIDRFVLETNGRRIPYGIGCAWLGRSGVGLRPEETDVLHRALDLGFRYFDTSSAYGDSELCVGEFLRMIDRSRVFVATKTHIKTALGPDQIRQRVARSLERLGTDYLDLMQIHDIESEDGLFDAANLDRAKEVVAELKASGLIRSFGLATRSIDLHRKAVDSGLFDAHLTYNDLTPLAIGAIPLLEKVRETGAVLINGSPLASGLLAGSDPAGLSVHPTRVGRKNRAVEFYNHCGRFGVSPLAAALQFPLRFPEVCMNLTGPANREELESTLDALAIEVPDKLWADWPVSQEEPL